MLFSHVACAVESFRVASDRPGAFGDEIVIEGWFLSHVKPRSMYVRFRVGPTLEVHDRRRRSEGLVRDYSKSFGEAAGQSRFLVVEPVGMNVWDFGSAEFHVEFEDGGRAAWPIGALFERPQGSTFSADDAKLIMSFESIGDSCEFGLVQRMVGQERLGLLRYAGVGDVFRLANGIASGLGIFEEPDCIDVTQLGSEWIAAVPGLNVNFHTGRSVSTISLEEIRQQEGRKLAFMAQKFIEDCEAGNKIFVYRVHRDARGGADGTRGMEELYAALRRHGPAKLLWVNVEDDAHPHGTLVQVHDGLYRGYIDHLAPASNAFDFRPRSWLDLLARAKEQMEQPAGSKLGFLRRALKIGRDPVSTVGRAKPPVPVHAFEPLFATLLEPGRAAALPADEPGASVMAPVVAPVVAPALAMSEAAAPAPPDDAAPALLPPAATEAVRTEAQALWSPPPVVEEPLDTSGVIVIDSIVFQTAGIAITGWAWFGSPVSAMRLVSARDARSVHAFRNFQLPSSDVAAHHGPAASHVRFNELVSGWPSWDAYGIAFAVLHVTLQDGRELRAALTKLERDLAPEPPRLARAPRLGIGVTTYNRRDLLEQVLENVAAHTTYPYELIVCDDGSKDDTVEMLRRRETPHIAAPNRGIAWNKNRVFHYLAEVRRCDVLIILEDDTAPAKANWQHDWMAASLAYGHVNYRGDWFKEKPVTGWGHWYDPAQSRPFSGQCVGLSRHALAVAGYMDARFSGYGYEHIEHTLRLARHGFGIGMPTPGKPEERLYYLINGNVSVLASQSHGSDDLVKANAPAFHEAITDYSYRDAWRTPEQRETMLAEMAMAVTY